VKNRHILVFFAAAFLFISSRFALAEDFSADMISTSGKVTTAGKIFASGSKVRMEMPGSVSINRMDKNAVWVLMPGQKMYMELASSPQKIATGTDKMPGEISRQLVGNEFIDGNMTDKYEVVYKGSVNNQTVFMWIDKGLNFPVRMKAEDGSWTLDYKNIKKGAQDPALFEIPAGYQKLSSGFSR